MNNELENLVKMNLSLMEDEASRLIYLSQVYYQVTGDYAYIADMLARLVHSYPESFSSEQFRKALEHVLPEIDKKIPVSRFMVDSGTMFFDPQIVCLTDHEVFCDCGALEMGTSLEFAYRVGDHFRAIHAFEPDPVCAEMCQANRIMFDKQVRDRVFVHDFGLDETAGKKPFARSNVPGNSRIVTESEEVIEVRTLDSLEELREVSFLKIHTEGSELAVIKGALETIRRNHPTLAVSLYHNLKELVNVPVLLHAAVPDYHFYMRHYSSGTSESVLYAVVR